MNVLGKLLGSVPWGKLLAQFQSRGALGGKYPESLKPPGAFWE